MGTSVADTLASAVWVDTDTRDVGLAILKLDDEEHHALRPQ